MFYYYRDYDSYFKLGIYFDIDESNAYRWVKWCEETLQNYSIEPFNNQSLTKEKEYIVDVMECPIERPKMQEIQKEYYSGKRKNTPSKSKSLLNQIQKELYMLLLIKEVFMILTYLKIQPKI